MGPVNNSANISSQANAPLSNYTEMTTFTPRIDGSSSAGVGTYTLQTGFWHSLGKLIFVIGSVSWSAHTGTGNMLIANLPFAITNTANYDPECSVRTDSIPWPAGSTYIFGEFQVGQTYLEISGLRTNGTIQLLQMNGSGTVHFTGFYLT